MDIHFALFLSIFVLVNGAVAPKKTTKIFTDDELGKAIEKYGAVNINDYMQSNKRLPGVTLAHEVFKVHCYHAKSGWRDVWPILFKNLEACDYFDKILIHKDARKDARLGIKPFLSALCRFLFKKDGPEIWSYHRSLEALGEFINPKLKKYDVDFMNMIACSPSYPS